MASIQRKPVTVQSGIVVDTDVADCEAISNEAASALMVRRTSGTVATVNVFGATEIDGTYLQMTFEGSDLTSTISATDWEVLPKETFAAPWIKLVGDATGVVEVAGKG
jgi:hypothetical protein